MFFFKLLIFFNLASNLFFMLETCQKIPSFYITHGGGPLPLLGDDGHKELVQHLKQIPNTIQKPKAILVISAHWEAEVPTILTKPSSGLLFDYYGFPEESYKLKYPAKLAEDVNKKLEELFQQNNIEYGKKENRGFDHGVFVPLMIMYPDADIPITQLSLCENLSPEYHLKLGEILSPLQDQGVLILGSGSSYHNMKAFFNFNQKYEEQAIQFASYLADTCTNPKYSQKERYNLMSNWKKAPGGLSSHPREEHLAPLFVIMGTGKGKIGKQTLNIKLFGYPALEFSFVN